MSLSDTWLYDRDMNTWQLVCMPCPPGPRRSTRMVHYGGPGHDPMIVMFGGDDQMGVDSPLGDTWIFGTDKVWKLCTCSDHPSKRSSPGMAWFRSNDTALN